MERIYLDHAATTPMHPKVAEKIFEAHNVNFGNASSIHSFEREARHLLDQARETKAASIGAKQNEIIFTSGGTEADNMALFGVAESYQKMESILSQLKSNTMLFCMRVKN